MSEAEKVVPAAKEDEKSGSSESKKFSELRTTTAAGAGHQNPFDFSAMTGLLNDPSIKELAEQIAKDPSFNQMAEQLQKTFQGVAVEDGIPNFDSQQYYSTMQQVMQNPQFMTMAEQLGSALMQDPSMSSMLEYLTNPSQKDQIGERMTRIKADPSLKPILEEIESGGPAVMMRYWNDQDVLKKLGEAMGFAVAGEGATSAEVSEPDETEEANEDESVVHQCAIVGDVEVLMNVLLEKSPHLNSSLIQAKSASTFLGLYFKGDKKESKPQRAQGHMDVVGGSILHFKWSNIAYGR